MTGGAEAYEPAVIASRLAYQLRCQTMVLIGCVRPEMFDGLPSVDLVGFDAPEHLDYAATALPSGRWLPLARVVDTVGTLPAPFVVLSVTALRELDDEAVRPLLRAAPAALVHDVDGRAGHGPAALRQLIESIRNRGFELVRGELIAPLGSTTHRRSSPALVMSDGHDRRPHDLVSTGLHGLRLDPAVASWSEPQTPSRVCIISYEVVGPCRNGGIGTANTSLALSLARAGHDVTLIYTGTPTEPHERDHWVQHFHERGVTYEELDDSAVAAVSSPFVNVRRAWAVYERVRGLDEDRPFDVIHGPDCQGHLVFIALGKRHGIAFGNAQIVAGAHSPTRWCAEANRSPLGTLSGLADEHLEQVSVARSDALISPSGYMLSYMRARGWELPARSFVQQYPASDALRDLLAGVGEPEEEPPQWPPSEIVFFGRLEKRKGIEAFCDALDRLVDEPMLRPVGITFLGSAVQIGWEASTEYVERRARSWPWTVRLETEMSQPDAVRRLRNGRCLAVMPSLVDNLPNTVYEAIALGIPLIVSRSGGTPELIAIEDLERCSVAGWPEDDVLEPAPAGIAARDFDDAALAEVIRSVVRERPAPVRPAVDPSANEACHSAWHAALARRGVPAPTPAPLPSLSMVLVTSEPTALRSIAAQLRAEDCEVVLPLGDKSLLSPDVPSDWLVLDTPQATAGRAHNISANAASGQLLLFLSDEVVPDPRLSARVRTAAASSDADVLLFPVYDCADGEDELERVVVPVGGPAVLALSHEFFGTSGFAIRAEALRLLGGFSDGDRSDNPSTDLLTRAVASGLRFEVVPEVLGRRVTPEPRRSLARNELWLEGVPWLMDAEQVLALLRPFQRSETTADLPALYRSSQELLARVLTDHRAERARLEASVNDFRALADSYQQAYNDFRAHADRLQQAYDDLRAHTDRVQQAYDDTHAHAERVQQAYEATRAHAERLQLEHEQTRRDLDIQQERADRHARHLDLARAETQQLQARIDTVYSSRSWKLTAPLRALSRLRRRIKR